MVAVRDVDLALTDVGAGPAFFWGHGFSSCRADDDRNGMLRWSRLADHHRVVRWDARGHGDSTGTTDAEDYRWDNLAADLLALADALGVDRFVAGGVSMGAATALHAAVRAPDRVDAVVLALPPTAYETRAAQAAEYRAGADTVERDGIDAYVAEVNARPVPAILNAFASTYRYEPRVAADLLPAALRGAGLSDLPPADAIRSVESPALVLAWEGDPGHPSSTAERLAELLPNAELHIARRLRDIAGWTELGVELLDAVDRAAPD